MKLSFSQKAKALIQRFFGQPETFKLSEEQATKYTFLMNERAAAENDEHLRLKFIVAAFGGCIADKGCEHFISAPRTLSREVIEAAYIMLMEYKLNLQKRMTEMEAAVPRNTGGQTRNEMLGGDERIKF